MTGFPSKKAAALDEEGMYLVHHTKSRVFDKLGNKVKEDDDDTQVYADALTIAYQSGFFDGKKAAQRTWVGLTKMELIKCGVFPWGMSYRLYEAIEAKLKEKNA